MTYYTPLKYDQTLFLERRAAFLRRKREIQKCEDSRRKPSRKTKLKNRRTLEAMQAVVKLEKAKKKGKPVCINIRHITSRIPMVQKWQYLDECNKVFFYQLALENAEKRGGGLKLTPFTFNASNELVGAFYRQKTKKLADFLRDHITEALKGLNRPVEYYFVIETAGRGKLHLQGAMLIAEPEQSLIRKALAKVNRKMTTGEKRSFLEWGLNSRNETINAYGNLYATLNWADYNLKEYRRNMLGYSLKNVTASSAPMTRLAKEYHARFRQLKKQSKLPAHCAHYA
ncbi:hypothetical protein Q9L42_004630 [Methylomarinum sp. Ch1-1]|uniref:Replication initiation protein n=1 Tax=Methylomarinum roseum TaxID=3067653 RepID=A0AAU7NWI1_9GAMM